MKNQPHLGKETKSASGQLVISQVWCTKSEIDNLIAYTNGEIAKCVNVWDEGLPRT